MNKQNVKQPTIKDTASVPPVVSVEQALATLSGFERQKAELIERKAALNDQRRNVAYDAYAHTDDGAAAKLLDGVHQQSVELESRLSSINDAIAEATRRVEAAKAHEAKAADRDRAMKVQSALQDLRGHARGLDAALALLHDALLGMNDAATAIHQNGATHPTYEQIEAFAYRCIVGGMANTSLRRRFEVLPPGERYRSMAQIAATWADSVERAIAARLGDGPGIDPL